MSRYLFKDRDGQTHLPEEWYRTLIPKHIQTAGELDEFEEMNISLGLVWLEKQKDPGTENQFWRTLHKHLFREVWTWAGEIRQHELNHPDFCHPRQIWVELKKLEEDLQFWATSSIDRTEVAAMFHERLLTIHPFANGNGRFSRILVEHYCIKNEIQKPTWGSHLQDRSVRRKKYIDSLMKARHEKNYRELIDFMFA